MKQKRAKALMFFMSVLVLVVIVIRCMTLDKLTVSGSCHLLACVFLEVYGIWLYKKPHGNMLRYVMLVFAFTTIIASCYLLLGGHNSWVQITKILASAAVCYCAGRLGRIDQNKYLLAVIGLAYLFASCYAAYEVVLRTPVDVLLILSCFSFTIAFAAIVTAYFVRFEEHKLAGLTDTPKK